MSSARAKRILTMRVLAVVATLATMLVVGASAGTADASTCDATVSDEAGLVAAAACYSTELAGSATVVTLSGDVALTSSLVLNNTTTATFAINGAGNTLMGVLDSGSVDGIDLQAGHLILLELSYQARSKNGVRLSQNTSIMMTNTVIDAVANVSTPISAGQPGTSVSLANSSIGGSFLAAIESEGTVEMVDSTLRGRSGLRGFAGSQLTVTNSTLHGDLTGFSGTGLQADGAALLTGVTIKDYASGGIAGTGTVSLEGVLLASINNVACAAGLGVTNLGGNTVKDDSCGTIVGTEFQSSAALGLGPLMDNGCAPSLVSCPQTVAISGVDSPAIDAWPGCALTDDQRGFDRAPGACDSGAFEGVDCPGDVGTPEQLEFGIHCYNRAGAGSTQSLTLDADLTLIEELPLIDNDTNAVLAIDGAGHTLTTLDDAVGVIVIDGDLRVEDLTIAGASSDAIQLQGDSDLSLVESRITGTTGTAINGLSGANISDVLVLRSELDGNEVGIRRVFNLTVDSSTITGSTGDAGSRGIVPGGGTTTIVNSTFAENHFALQIQGGTTNVTNSTFAHNSSAGIGMVTGGSGTVTLIDSMSFNTNGACSPIEPSRMVDGGGNVMLGDCGPIDGIDVNPGDPDWLALLPPLAQNACAVGVNCTRTVAPPAGFPTAGAGESCGLMVDQRGVERPASNCDAGAVEIANELPTANDDTDPAFTLTEDDPATVLDVLANDSDPDPGDTLVVQSATQPASGGIASVVNGELVFTPAANFAGSAQFTYTMTDGSDATDSASVLVNVMAVNDPPVPVNDNITVPKNGTDRSEPASNDTDVEGTALTVVSVTQPPVGEGAASVFANQFVDYTPPIGFVGMTSFTYTVADADGGTAVGTISVDVTGANDPPVASPDSGDGIQNGDPILIDVLDNDTDVDQDDLVVLSLTQPQGGRTVLVGNDVEYTPDLDFFGSDSFTYVVSDGRGGTDTGNVSITVTALAPLLCNGLPVTIDMSSNGGNGVGTSGDDVILGTAGDDVIDGGDGDDTVCAGDGDDQVVGGTGDDTIFGEGGRDIVRGNPGSDTIDGGPGRDRLLGGIDDDTISGGDGDDYIGGFGGNDIIDGGPGNETIFGGFGADTIDGGLGNDKIFGLIGNDIIDGGAGNDQLNGDRGNDTIRGGSGNDTINGGNANDTLFGEAGDDTVSGGKADDTLSGGPDTDVCSGNLQTVADTVDATCETFFGIP